MRLKALAELHKLVIHTDYKTVYMKEIELEDQWIKKYPYDVIENVCSDCFRSPDADIKPVDLICLKGQDIQYLDKRTSLNFKQINSVEI